MAARGGGAGVGWVCGDGAAAADVLARGAGAEGPVAWLEPFRIANPYGLFAVMTPHRYEIEFQGSQDGPIGLRIRFATSRRRWTSGHGSMRRISRASTGTCGSLRWEAWREYPWVARTEELLLENDRGGAGAVCGRIRLRARRRSMVRAVLWQYWFSTPEEKRTQGVWWTRKVLGTYAPTLVRLPDGGFGIVRTDLPASEELRRP